MTHFEAWLQNGFILSKAVDAGPSICSLCVGEALFRNRRIGQFPGISIRTKPLDLRIGECTEDLPPMVTDLRRDLGFKTSALRIASPARFFLR